MLPAVLAVIVSLAGTPVVGVVCGLACAKTSTAPAAGGHHHNHGSEQPGGTVTSVHTCGPDVAVDPFILQAATQDWPSQLGPLSQVSPEASAPAQSIVAEVWLASTDVGDTLHRRPTVLRI